MFAVFTVWVILEYPNGQPSGTMLLLIAELLLTTQFDDFKAQYSRAYASPEEEAAKRQAFEANLNFIKHCNAEADAGRSSYRCGVGPFADLTSEEFRKQRLGLLKTKTEKTPTALVEEKLVEEKLLLAATPPATVDCERAAGSTPCKSTTPSTKGS